MLNLFPPGAGGYCNVLRVNSDSPSQQDNHKGQQAENENTEKKFEHFETPLPAKELLTHSASIPKTKTRTQKMKKISSILKPLCLLLAYRPIARETLACQLDCKSQAKLPAPLQRAALRCGGRVGAPALPGLPGG